jgi:L-alanine-DL-glutamate epimerase-like enolase superfamily enzyme
VPSEICVQAVRARRAEVRLTKPLLFGPMAIRERTYLLVDVELNDGSVGTARTLDRGFDLRSAVHEIVAPAYERASIEDPGRAWWRALRGSSPSLSAGAGLRALSLVDIAFRNAARSSQASEDVFVQPPPPVWSIIGYPPDSSPHQVAIEASAAIRAGAAGVKLPRAQNAKATRERLSAAVNAVGAHRVALDLAWSFRSASEAAHVVDGFDLAWLEDPFPPGNLAELIRLRSMLSFPLASGDEDANLYSPDILVESGAVDIVRLDATCQGGVTRMIDFADRFAGHPVSVSWHMNSSIHERLARELDLTSISVEVSSAGAGVDPLEEDEQTLLGGSSPAGADS